MSLFPRHLQEGQTLLLHLRLSPTPPCFPYVDITIRNPRGESVFERAGQQVSWVPETPVVPRLPRALAPGLYETVPLAFLARYLCEDATEQNDMVRLLEDIRHARHWYLAWTVPAGALAGRYEVEVSTWIAGHRHASPTAQDDHFFVERLSLEEWQATSGGAVAHIRNHSPAPTRARLHEFFRDPSTDSRPGVRAAVRELSLAPHSITELRLESECALLQYAEDGARLWLTSDRRGPLIRNQTCAWMHARDQSVVVTSQRRRRSFTLSGASREIWLAADGALSEERLRAFGSTALEALLSAELLVPLL